MGLSLKAFSLALRHGRSYMAAHDVPGSARLSVLKLPFREQVHVMSVSEQKRLTGRSGASCFLCDPVGIRTQDPQLRRLLLYPAELLDHPYFVVQR